MRILVEDLKPGLVSGIRVQLPKESSISDDSYFIWSESSLTASFQTKDISGGVLCSVRKEIKFQEMEYHQDDEMFYFTSGIGIMAFCDIQNGKVISESIQLVRIRQGTQIIIEKGKGHFVPVAESEKMLKIIVVSPKMEALKVMTDEVIEGDVE